MSNKILGRNDNFTVYLDSQQRKIRIENDNGHDANWSDNPPILLDDKGEKAGGGTVKAHGMTEWMPVIPSSYVRTTFTFTFISRVPSPSIQVNTPSVQRLEVQARILEAQARILEVLVEIDIETDLERGL